MLKSDYMLISWCAQMCLNLLQCRLGYVMYLGTDKSINYLDKDKVKTLFTWTKKKNPNLKF